MLATSPADLEKIGPRKFMLSVAVAGPSLFQATSEDKMPLPEKYVTVRFPVSGCGLLQLLHTSPTLINSIQVDMHWLY
jgi:hypothetical protein